GNIINSFRKSNDVSKLGFARNRFSGSTMRCIIIHVLGVLATFKASRINSWISIHFRIYLAYFNNK
ncbi:hypothetical protein CWI38_2233p0010, partial [Hamiltosporidium tvaerminnensis]